MRLRAGRIVAGVALAVAFSALLCGCSDPGRELGEAVEAGDLPTVRRIAAEHPEAVNAVIAMGDIGWESSPLVIAVSNKRYVIAQYLIRRGAGLSFRDSWLGTPLQQAIGQEDYRMARLLLSAGAPPNDRGYQARTALHQAAGSGSERLVKLLLAHGAGPSLKDKSGKTPSDYARKNGYGGIVKLLKSHPPPKGHP